jgi:hypothetical protein
MEPSDPLMVFFLVIACISMVSTSAVIYHIYTRLNFDDLRVPLLFFMHVSVLLEDLSTLPYAFSWNNQLCDIFGWLHFYSGFWNINIVTLLGFHYLAGITSGKWSHKINKYINKYGFRLSFFLPMITLLPFSTDSYGKSNDHWCTLPSGSRQSNNWAIAVFYSWIWTLILVNIIQFSYSFYQSWKFDKELCKRLMLTIGLYIFVTILCWLPRTIPRFLHLFLSFSTSDRLYLLTTLPLYLSGIGYAICYTIDYQLVARERRTSSVDSNQLSGLRISHIEELFRESSAENPLLVMTVERESTPDRGSGWGIGSKPNSYQPPSSLNNTL